MSNLLWFCFWLSGAAALAFEMLWVRSAGLVLGTTVHITATVLACYFAGLGLGSACARRVSSRPVRLYGLSRTRSSRGRDLVAGDFLVLAHDAAQLWLFTAGIFGRVAAIALATVPTTLMLGRNPSNSRSGSRQHRHYRTTWRPAVRGQHRGWCARCRRRGLWSSRARRRARKLWYRRWRQLGSGTHCNHDPQIADETTPVKKSALGSESFIRANWAPASRRRRHRLPRPRARSSLTHLFAQVLHNSVYSFTAIVLVFLLAIATGAVLATLALRHAAPSTVAASALVVAAGATIGGIWLFLYSRWAHLLRHAHRVIGISPEDHNLGRCDCRPCRYRIGNGFACAVGRMG